MKVKTYVINIIVLSLSLGSSIALADEWSYEVEVYLLATTIEGDASIGRITGAEVDVNFDTILESLDLGGMMHAEAHHDSGGGWR
jgi:hypothetical protein